MMHGQIRSCQSNGSEQIYAAKIWTTRFGGKINHLMLRETETNVISCAGCYAQLRFQFDCLGKRFSSRRLAASIHRIRPMQRQRLLHSISNSFRPFVRKEFSLVARR